MQINLYYFEMLHYVIKCNTGVNYEQKGNTNKNIFVFYFLLDSYKSAAGLT